MVKKKGMGEQAPHFRPPKGRAGGGKQGVAAAIRKQRIKKKEVLWKNLEQLTPLPQLPPPPNRACKHASASADLDAVNPAPEEVNDDLLPPPRPPEQPLDLELTFSPELPARADLAPVLADLQLLFSSLGSKHKIDNAGLPPDQYLLKIHLNLPPDEAQLFRDLLRGKDSARPGVHPMPRDRDRAFVFTDRGAARAHQHQDKAQPEGRREQLWIPYDPQLRTKADPARLRRVL
jgi:hypothetical protein